MTGRAVALLCAGLLSTSAAAAPVCTLVETQDGAILHQDGDCATRESPASTFKIALAVMGYDVGILVDAHQPVWPYRPQYAAARASWRADVDPTYWMLNSVVWYSQKLTRALGLERLTRYVDAFDYGNRDLSGDPEKRDGLTQAWLGSSLAISPAGQARFLRALLELALPASPQAQRRAMEIVPAFAAAGGWSVRGKTGGAQPRGAADRSFGWFVGWAEKDGRRVVFARLTRVEAPSAAVAAVEARDGLLAELAGFAGDGGKPATRRDP